MTKIIRKYKDIVFEETTVIGYMVYEGMPFEEAVLSYKSRQKLPANVFCGPNRSYPIPDAKHARNALARLSQFKHRLKKGVAARVEACIKRKAKSFGVEISETVPDALKWFLENNKIDKEVK